MFPDPEKADADGLVAYGGDLKPRTLVEAYCRGIFPWFDEESPILWWSPDPRAIFELDGFHTSRRLARTLRTGRFTCTLDRDFAGVIQGCADREEGSWITPDMIQAYTDLHQRGLAHSVECWQDGELAGGVYGVALKGFFAGESMFHRRTDASKIALAFLLGHLRQRSFQLFDIQMITPHTRSLGAVEIPRREYLKRLRAALQCEATFS